MPIGDDDDVDQTDIDEFQEGFDQYSGLEKFYKNGQIYDITTQNIDISN